MSESIGAPDLQAPTPALSGALCSALLRSVLDPTLVIDERGNVLLASDTVETAFGWPPAELVGRNIKELMGEPHRSSHDEYLERYRLTGQTNILGRTREFEVRHRDGRVLSCELSVARVDAEDYGEPLFIGSFRDLTERKRAQRAETAMMSALATIGESAAMLAHEIKNPITAVNMALRAVASRLGTDQQEVLQDLVQRMQRLESVVRRTLGFARPLTLRPARIDAGELLAAAVRELRPEIVKRAAEVEVHAPAPPIAFEADRALLGEALTNLIKNALEACERGGRVQLRAERAGRCGVCLTIEDDGPGLPERQMETLFKPFATTKAGGTGLGLSFCKKVVEQHGGTIEAERGRARGARFRIELPAQREGE